MPRRNVLAAGISLIASRAPVEGQAVSDAPASREELQYMGVMELAEKLRKREFSPVEVTKAQLTRIAALEPKLMAYDTTSSSGSGVATGGRPPLCSPGYLNDSSAWTDGAGVRKFSAKPVN